MTRAGRPWSLFIHCSFCASISSSASNAMNLEWGITGPSETGLTGSSTIQVQTEIKVTGAWNAHNQLQELENGMIWAPFP